jgi:predicted AlkP superfamily phosphohydrolase/phosphomutase
METREREQEHCQPVGPEINRHRFILDCVRRFAHSRARAPLGRLARPDARRCGARIAAFLIALIPILAGCAENGGESSPQARRSGPRLLIVGWDGASFDLIDRSIAAGHLPNLASLMEGGAQARLVSTIVPISSSAWIGAMTGKGPGKTGVYAFFEPVDGSYDVRLISARSNRAAPVWRILTARGLASNVFGVPVTWPPEAVFGTMVAGMLSPFDSVYTHPPEYADALRSRGFVPDLGIWRNEEKSGARRFRQQLAIKRRAVGELLSRPDWDLSIVVFKSLDIISHRGYALALGGPVARWMRELDAVLGEMVATVGPDTNVIVMSDHGFAAYRRGINLHAWLIEAGFAAHSQRDAESVPSGALAERRLEQHRRLMAELDMSKTRAFAGVSEGNFSSLRANVIGREPQGIVAPEDLDALLDEISAKLSELRFEGEGPPLVRRTIRGEAEYPGPERGVVPDLLIEFREDVNAVTDRRPEVFFAKARPRPDHARDGILILSGPSVAPRAARGEASILDIAPTALHLLGQPVYAEMDGRARTEFLVDAAPPRVISEADDPRYPAAPDAASPYTAEDLEAIVERLEALGYVQ